MQLREQAKDESVKCQQAFFHVCFPGNYIFAILDHFIAILLGIHAKKCYRYLEGVNTLQTSHAYLLGRRRSDGLSDDVIFVALGWGDLRFRRNFRRSLLRRGSSETFGWLGDDRNWG